MSLKTFIYSLAGLAMVGTAAIWVASTSSNPASKLAATITAEAAILEDEKITEVTQNAHTKRICIQPAYVTESDFRKLTGINASSFKVGTSVNFTGIHALDHNGTASSSYIDSRELRIDPSILKLGLCFDSEEKILLRRSGQFVFIFKSQE